METEVQTVNRLLELGAAKILPQKLETGEPFIVIPATCKVERLGEIITPGHIKRSVSLLEAGSFADYVNRFKTDCTQIFALVTDTGGKFVAVLDYHGPAPELKASFCDHLAIYEPIQTVEFKSWMEANRRRMGQVEFAVWLEENAAVLKEPVGAELLELVQTLHGHSEARFNQTFRLKDGSCKIQFDEDVVVRGTSAASSKPGELELPDTITAGIAPFQGAPLYEIKARLRVRLENRKLSLWFETIAPHQIIRDSLMLATRAIAEKTGLIPLLGSCG